MHHCCKCNFSYLSHILCHPTHTTSSSLVVALRVFRRRWVLGALRNVLIIDNQLPCNRQTPHSHNFLTQDGEPPLLILEKARQQVLAYSTIEWKIATAVQAHKSEAGFEVVLQSGESYGAKKLVFATGIKDNLETFKGLSACWGISVIHCPYCHGFEVKNTPTAVIGNGDEGFEYVKMISNWTKELTLCTNGPSTLSQEQRLKLAKNGINVVESEIDEFLHQDGHIEHLLFKNQEKLPVKAVYHRPSFEQHTALPAQLGCELTPQGYIQVNEMQQTSQPGILAAGDNTSPFRSVANAVAKGSMAAAVLNRELIEESF